jgi:PAT family beta-lactamase induction signal transducer AmpG
LNPSPSLLRSKLYWVGILYFAQGLPFGIFYDVLPVYFCELGVDLRQIGFLSLLGLAWTVKFLWAPAVDHYRHHRRWMFVVDLAMGACLVFLAMQAGFGPPTWFAIALFTLFSATNDIAIDGYTIELLSKEELGLANGVRIGMGRVGILAAGGVLILSDYAGWLGAYLIAAATLAVLAVVCLNAPKELAFGAQRALTLRRELAAIVRKPRALAIVLAFLVGTLWLIDNVTRWSAKLAYFWWLVLGVAAALIVLSIVRDARANAAPADANGEPVAELARGPMFGALMEMLSRPYIYGVILFVLTFKLGDAAMGFMVKPFWKSAGFTNAEIGLVSVNIGLALSIAGGLVGGWLTDRIGIFKALWILGLFQAVSNLGYVWVASVLPPVVLPESGGAAAGCAAPPPDAATVARPLEHALMLYSASALESFTGGLGTAAFLAFLMRIVDKQHSAAEYAILSSLFALTRHLAGFASGYGAHYLGYAPYFALTFLLAFPAYLLLPWVRKTLAWTDAHSAPTPPR